MKSVILGDGAVGKTSLLIVFNTNKFPYDYIPTVFDNYNSKVIFQNVPTEICIWDTAGGEDYDRLRPLSYPQTDVFVLCYSISSKNSFTNIVQKWIPEIQYHMPGVPFILVGTKGDLRDTPLQQVTFEEAELVAKNHGAFSHIVCSALNQFNVKLAVNTAIQAALQYQQEFETRKQCCK
ncbi:Rac/Rho-like_protein [Hexamita inflata]|uniref:Rac/Rho-like protein n=1 Tax=Hexamita inflata TaxID=28002 RepID=A0AA86V4D4_9EUKA|nr:Rac/Rho-like protein [Hexamita inflata]